MKRSIYILLGAGMVSLLAGCATQPVALAPVGPNPAGIRTGTETLASHGGLVVYTRLTGRAEGDNPTWYQHSSYSIYTLDGKMLKRVDNSTGHYALAPREVTLPPGNYIVKARSKDYVLVQVPVTIERGRTTRVHLDDNWSLPPDAPKNEVVSMPDGNPVGWSAE